MFGVGGALFLLSSTHTHPWTSAEDSQTWLPAAVALGRSETVMSGGKPMLGGSSTSTSGPSAILLKGSRSPPERADTVSRKHRRAAGRVQRRDNHINKRDCVVEGVCSDNWATS